MTISRVRVTEGYDPELGATATDGATVAVPGAFVAPRVSDEVSGVGRSGVVVGLSLFAPYDADVLAADAIVVAGEGASDGRYRIVGEVGPWRHPMTGWEAGITAALERAAG